MWSHFPVIIQPFASIPQGWLVPHPGTERWRPGHGCCLAQSPQRISSL